MRYHEESELWTEAAPSIRLTRVKQSMDDLHHLIEQTRSKLNYHPYKYQHLKSSQTQIPKYSTPHKYTSSHLYNKSHQNTTDVQHYQGDQLHREDHQFTRKKEREQFYTEGTQRKNKMPSDEEQNSGIYTFSDVKEKNIYVKNQHNFQSSLPIFANPNQTPKKKSLFINSSAETNRPSKKYSAQKERSKTKNLELAKALFGQESTQNKLIRKNPYNLKDYYESNRVTPRNYLNIKQYQKSNSRSTRAFKVDLKDYSSNKSVNFIKTSKSPKSAYRNRLGKEESFRNSQSKRNNDKHKKSLSPRCEAVTNRLYDYRCVLPCSRCQRHHGVDIGYEMKKIIKQNSFIKRYLNDEEIRDICLELEYEGIPKESWSSELVSIVFKKLKRIYIP